MPRPQNVQSPAHRPAGRVRGELLLHYIFNSQSEKVIKNNAVGTALFFCNHL